MRKSTIGLGKRICSLRVCRLWSNTDNTLNLDNKVSMTKILVPILSQLKLENDSAYLNEGDFQEPNWQQVFYGLNHHRLLEIKEQYDPQGFLWGRTAVGSEKQVVDKNGRLCRIDD